MNILKKLPKRALKTSGIRFQLAQVASQINDPLYNENFHSKVLEDKNNELLKEIQDFTNILKNQNHFLNYSENLSIQHKNFPENFENRLSAGEEFTKDFSKIDPSSPNFFKNHATTIFWDEDF